MSIETSGKRVSPGVFCHAPNCNGCGDDMLKRCEYAQANAEDPDLKEMLSKMIVEGYQQATRCGRF
jgi:hypothetical protein